MMDGGHDRKRPCRKQQAVAQALVVVNHIEIAAVASQVTPGPQAEGKRFRVSGGAHDSELGGVDPVLDFSIWPERIARPVEVKTWQPDLVNALIEARVGRTGHHRDSMAEVIQCAGELPSVDALTAAEGVSAIAQEGNSKRFLC